MKPFEVNNKNETINQRIARYRRAVGLTQKDMARLLGSKSSTYAQKERCGEIDFGFVLKVAEILGIDPVVLFLGEKEWVPVSPAFNLSNQEESLILMLRKMKERYRNLAYEMIYALTKSK